jgi:hypothetical protein
MVCRKFNSHVYKLKGRLLGNTFVFILHGVQRDASIGGVLNVPQKNDDGPMNMALSKKKKVKKSYELINMNHTMYIPLYSLR